MGLHLDAGLTQENFVSKQEPLPPSPVLLGWVGGGGPGPFFMDQVCFNVSPSVCLPREAAGQGTTGERELKVFRPLPLGSAVQRPRQTPGPRVRNSVLPCLTVPRVEHVGASVSYSVMAGD